MVARFQKKGARSRTPLDVSPEIRLVCSQSAVHDRQSVEDFEFWILKERAGPTQVQCSVGRRWCPDIAIGFGLAQC